MAQNLAKLPHKLDPKAGVCRVVIETPKGRSGKLDYDPKSGLFRLKTLLPDGMSFPLDFGFVPSTLCDDGDPLDVMVLADEPNLPGTLLDVRLVGVIEAEEVEHGKSERNDRLIAAASVSHLYASVKNIAELDNDFTDNLIQFWTVSKARFSGIGYHTHLMASKQLRGPGCSLSSWEMSFCLNRLSVSMRGESAG